MIAATTVQRVSLHFDPVGSWLLVAVVAIALLAVLLAVPPDRSRVSGSRLLLLMLLRLGGFLALVLCMVRPSFVSTRPARQQGPGVVLAPYSAAQLPPGALARTGPPLTLALAAANEGSLLRRPGLRRALLELLEALP